MAPFLTAFGKSDDSALYGRLLGYMRPYWKHFTLAMLSSLPVAGLQGAAAWMIGPFTDRILKSQDYSILYAIPAALIAASIVQGVCQYVNEYYTGRVGQCITQTLRSELFAKLRAMDLLYFKRSQWNDIYSRYCTDPAQLQLAVNDNLQDLIVKIITILGLAGVLLYRNWAYALVSILIISTVVFPLAIVSKKIRRMDHVSRDISVKLFSIAHELTIGIKIVKVFQLNAYQEARYERTLKDLFSNSMRIMKAGVVLKPLMHLITAFGLSIVFVIGVYQIQQRQMTPGDLTSFIVALVLLIQPIKTVGSVLAKMQRIFAPAERVFEKLDLTPTLTAPERPQTIAGFESLEFQQVSFEYEPGVPVLREISLQAKAGETIALVGPSGGGKSTLVELIPRFMDPQAGRILMNGVDLRDLSPESIFNQIAIVSQDAILFDGTIRENIALGNLKASDADIRRAMEMAYLTDWVDSLEHGWDSPVGEFGGFLSGGQKQRVTIARAFLKNAPVLILDEATSALDNESEAIVQRALAHLLKDRTVFVIAHRLSTIRHATRILALEKGRIVEEGDHDALLARGGLYHKLYQMQFQKRSTPDGTPSDETPEQAANADLSFA